jgi:hypothetical protein
MVQNTNLLATNIHIAPTNYSRFHEPGGLLVFGKEFAGNYNVGE